MYVILVYDFGEKRVNKMLKLCRKYLNWIQNSVFEGEISEARLKELLMQSDKFMKKGRRQYNYIQYSFSNLNGKTNYRKREVLC